MSGLLRGLTGDRHEEQAREARRLAGLLLEFHPGAVAITDASGILEAVSARFNRWFSNNGNSIHPGSDLLKVVAANDAYDYANILRYVIEQGKPVRDFRLHTVLQATERTVRVTVAPLRNSHNTLIGLLHVFEEAEPAQNLDRDMDHVEKLTNIGQIAAGMAHELNTPLGSIILSADLLRDTALPASAQAEITKIKQQATHCSVVVRRLLDYARRDDHERADHEIATIVRKVMSLVEVEARKRNITLDLTAESSPSRVRCDENQVEQLFFNLYSNALHAIGQNGRIHVQITDDALLNQTIISFSDTGCGIPEEHLERVFEPFFTTKPRAEGTGLGLALCTKIMAEHGGKIRVESHVGQGTTFTISFPVAG